MAGATPASPDEVRRQLRAWRRTRAELSVWRVLEEAYVAVLSTVIVGAMAVSVLLGGRDASAAACTGACAGARAALPWLVVPALVVGSLAVARLLGPVFVPPAAGPWLLATPVDRPGLLRRSLWRAVALAGLTAALVSPAVSVLAGLTASHVVAVAIAAVGCCVGGVVLAAHAQLNDTGSARPLTWLAMAVLWLGLAGVGLAPTTLPAPVLGTRPAWALAATGFLAAAVLAVVAVRSLAGAQRSSLMRTQDAWPSLSGAMAAMDLTLLYDVLLARRWSGARLRPRRGGPRGWWALVQRDWVRATRTPQAWLVLVGLVLVPYALARTDLSAGMALVIGLCGLLGLPAISSGLRVVARTPALAHTFPLATRSVRGAHLVLPALGAGFFAVACSPAVAGATGWTAAWPLVVAGGLSGLAASTRWICAGPPDYGRPLVTTPMGGLPPGLLAGAVRGFDIWALTGVPILFGPVGVLASIGLSIVVLAVLLGD